MSVSCVFACDHNGWSTPRRRFNKDTENWCNLKKTLFFPVRPRRYRRPWMRRNLRRQCGCAAGTLALLHAGFYFWLRLKFLFLHFCRSFENNLITYRLLSFRKTDSELPSVSSHQQNHVKGRFKPEHLFGVCFSSSSTEVWGFHGTLCYFLLRCLVRAVNTVTGPPKGSAGLLKMFSCAWWRIRLWPFLLLYLRRRRAGVSTSVVNPSPESFSFTRFFPPAQSALIQHKQGALHFWACLSSLRIFHQTVGKDQAPDSDWSDDPFTSVHFELLHTPPCCLLSPVVSDILLNSCRINVFIAFVTMTPLRLHVWGWRSNVSLLCKTSAASLHFWAACSFLHVRKT